MRDCINITRMLISNETQSLAVCATDRFANKNTLACSRPEARTSEWKAASRGGASSVLADALGRQRRRLMLQAFGAAGADVLTPSDESCRPDNIVEIVRFQIGAANKRRAAANRFRRCQKRFLQPLQASSARTANRTRHLASSKFKHW